MKDAERIQKIIKEDEIILKHAKDKEFLYHIADKITKEDYQNSLEGKERLKSLQDQIETFKTDTKKK